MNQKYEQINVSTFSTYDAPWGQAWYNARALTDTAHLGFDKIIVYSLYNLIFMSVREKLQFTVSFDHPVVYSLTDCIFLNLLAN